MFVSMFVCVFDHNLLAELPCILIGEIGKNYGHGLSLKNFKNFN